MDHPTPTPSQVRNAYESRLADACAQLQHRPPSKRSIAVPRVAQLDARLLDDELENILSEPVLKSLKLFASPRPAAFEPEILALIRYFLLRTSLQQYQATYGDWLQNLKYPILKQRRLESYAVASVLPDYVLSKIRDAMITRGWADYPPPQSWSLILPSRLLRCTESQTARRKRQRKRLAWEALVAVEKVLALARLANFVAFLYNGRYRSLLDRLLRLQMSCNNTSLAHLISFEFMNRQLVWETLTDFLYCVLPLINVRKLRKRLSKAIWSSFLFQWLRYLFPGGAPAPKPANEQPDEDDEGPLSHLSPSTCPICHSRTATSSQGLSGAEPVDPTDPTANLSQLSTSMSEDAEVKLPYRVNCCAGLYCYYCITSELCIWEEETAGLEGSWKCLRCGKDVTAIERAILVKGKAE